MEPEVLKSQVREFWNEQSCGTEITRSAKFSKEYFEEIESFRYFSEPFIHSFAQFSRYHGKRVLEVGFGAGTDFVQWLRCGAIAEGIDLTPEALHHLSERIAVCNLPKPACIQIGDAEKLPFESNRFDLGYSFGVLHHSPDTEKAVTELVRVVRPGGEVKIMLYNRHSIYIFNKWLRHAFLRGRPWKNLQWVLCEHIESPGTKGYTTGELLQIFKRLPVDTLHIHTECTSADYLSASAMPPLNCLFRLCLRLAGTKQGWHVRHYSTRVNDRDDAPGRAFQAQRDPAVPLVTGNRLGFFHCITARKLA